MFDIKILIGGLQQEVNSFAPGKTGIAEYSRRTIYWGQDLIDRLPNYTRRNDGMDSFAAAYRVLKEAGATVVSCGCMAAQPGAIIEQSIIDNYIEHVKQATRENLPLDGVVLFLADRHHSRRGTRGILLDLQAIDKHPPADHRYKSLGRGDRRVFRQQGALSRALPIYLPRPCATRHKTA